MNKPDPVPELSVEGPKLQIQNFQFLDRAQEYLKAGDQTKARYWLRRAVGLKG